VAEFPEGNGGGHGGEVEVVRLWSWFVDGKEMRFTPRVCGVPVLRHTYPADTCERLHGRLTVHKSNSGPTLLSRHTSVLCERFEFSSAVTLDPFFRAVEFVEAWTTLCIVVI